MRASWITSKTDLENKLNDIILSGIMQPCKAAWSTDAGLALRRFSSLHLWHFFLVEPLLKELSLSLRVHSLRQEDYSCAQVVLLLSSPSRQRVAFKKVSPYSINTVSFSLYSGHTLSIFLLSYGKPINSHITVILFWLLLQFTHQVRKTSLKYYEIFDESCLALEA